MISDPYAILGVARDATDEAIKSAYRKLAMQFHPDRNKEPGAEERFKEISVAYETIKDAGRRAQHAAGGQARQFHPGQGFGGFDFGFSFDDILRQHMHGARQQRNRDLSVPYEISLEQAFTGVRADLSLRAATGEPLNVTVNIPAGVDNGMRLRVAGGGERAHAHLPPGDLYVGIVVRPHATFSRHGQNLVMQARIDALDAMLGATISVPTIDGQTLEVEVPRELQSGAVMRLAGRGMPSMGGVRGDLLINAAITTPANLSAEQLALLRQVRELSRQPA